jgi:hypothetical protein
MSFRTIGLAAFVLILGLGLNSEAQSRLAPRFDNESWSDFQLAVPLNKTTDVVFLGVLRIGRNFSQPVNERAGVGISTKLGKYVTVFPFYQHIAAQPTSNNHSTEERITLEATGKFPVGHFVISDRNRVEFRFKRLQSRFTEYRNRLHIAHPIKIDKFEVEGFIADEIFYNSLFERWYRNRISIGIGKKINRHFTLELYYLRQNDGLARPGDINALGSAFKFRL